MAGRRIVDAAKLFNASKSIAQKHIALRSNQWDAYTKTSTLAKAVKNQTDRVTLTAAAAIALSQRFSEEAPAYAKAAAERATGAQRDSIPRRETVAADRPTTGVKEGLEQDHHYDRSGETTAADPPSEEELDIKQKDAPRRPLPDGTIPTAGLTLEQEERGQDTFSERPVPEAPKEPLEEDHGGATGTSSEGLRPKESTESTIPLPDRPAGSSSQAAETIPAHATDVQHPSIPTQLRKLQEGHDRDVFYSRSVESQPPVSPKPPVQIPANTGTQQGSDEHVQDGQLNQDVFYSPSKAEQQQAKEMKDEVPEGINTDVFHSRKVARMLGTDPFSRKEYAERKGSGRHPLDDRPLPKTTGRHPLDDRPLPEVNSSIKSRTLSQAQLSSNTKDMEDFASKLAQDVQLNAAASSETPAEISSQPESTPYALRESRVPSSRFGRLWQYAGLGTSMALGAVGEGLRRATGSAASSGGSLMLSPGNLEILVAKLSRMRGAALKLGQMISFQGT